MLASLTVHLFPVENSILPPTMGHYIYAAFLDILRQVNTKIAERLHVDQPCKPFTVSPLQGKFDKRGKGKVFIRAGAECWTRFTILDDDLLATVADFFLESKSSLLRLGNNIFQITRVAANGDSTDRSWSACTTFEEIFDCASPFDKLSFRFYSPTAFKVHDRETRGTQNYVFPDPLHCFQSWSRKWNALSPIPIDEDALLDFVQRHIRFSRYSIKTRIMNFGGYKQLGFVGDCNYQFVSSVFTPGPGKTNRKPQEPLKQADALANFAFYCGTGYKTTMGMGQTRRQKLVGTDEI
jgi:CRISPR-associated endoribonuclease Cas6